ncbi:sensor histidine kinase [Silvibacterium dinghuense]|uniref:histidine kinase n=1 Tax=Silvibacterium dinghuense TaxID=1560006 RepID=A0A4Q1SKA4_9BACT|nr:HAMP domain-containing sensor histidine kinase [Silvibacterium dinghuense]RXS97720.1 HAMP domain-containing histidine kinase [Silvibacterium dinghuense]GGH01429.1 hypothetical protein GCM10011586_16350 [Silvibacterium dinghuense]
MLSAISIPCVVFFTMDSTAVHGLRQSMRRIGLTARIESFDEREELLARLRSHDTDFLLIAEDAMARLDIFTLQEFLGHLSAAAPLSSLVLVEREPDSMDAALSAAHRAVLQGLQRSDSRRLPEYLERAFKLRRDQKMRASVQGEIDRTAEILRANQKLIALGRLTASIVHEINNPLESITNLLYLLEVDPSSEHRQEYLELAQSELSRVVQISRQTLNFSRESAGPVPVHPSELIEEVLTLYGRKIADKQLQVEREFETAETVKVLPGEMRQVFSNLIANSIEATAPGGRLRLRLRSARNWADQGVQGLRISVADTGSGMPAEVRSRIGEPFFTTKGAQGTGLGLWVSRSILHRYGGGLQLRSSVSGAHHGTVFSVFLPTNMRPQAVVASRAASVASTPQQTLLSLSDFDPTVSRAVNKG